MHTVAVVQAGSVPFDAEASVDKAIARLREAAGNGAELVVFPEAFIGGYPKGITFGAPLGMRTEQGRAQFAAVLRRAVTARRRRDRHARRGRPRGTVPSSSSGIIERTGETLYCTAVMIDPELGVVGRTSETHAHRHRAC